MSYGTLASAVIDMSLLGDNQRRLLRYAFSFGSNGEILKYQEDAEPDLLELAGMGYVEVNTDQKQWQLDDNFCRDLVVPLSSVKRACAQLSGEEPSDTEVDEVYAAFVNWLEQSPESAVVYFLRESGRYASQDKD